MAQGTGGAGARWFLYKTLLLQLQHKGAAMPRGGGQSCRKHGSKRCPLRDMKPWQGRSGGLGLVREGLSRRVLVQCAMDGLEGSGLRQATRHGLARVRSRNGGWGNGNPVPGLLSLPRSRLGAWCFCWLQEPAERPSKREAQRKVSNVGRAVWNAGEVA